MSTTLARIRGNLSSTSAVLAVAAIGIAIIPTSAAEAATAPRCSAFTRNIYERVNPTTQASTLMLDQTKSEATNKAGFTSPREVSMKAAPTSGSGLTAIHRLYRPRGGGDYFYATSTGSRDGAVKDRGYTDLGVAFYASTVKASCLVPVYSYIRAGVHRYVSTPSDMAALAAAGWTKERVRFYVGQPPVDTKFTLGVYPDTQQEVGTDKRFINRSNWLVANKAKLDLRFVAHTGDVVNWDTPDHAQYVVAQAALKPLASAKIPYSLAIGNHDSQATGPGGGARDSTRTRELARDTTVFNRYLNDQALNQEGAYERGKVDNAYHVFTAGGVGWLVLSLELWPRAGAVAWAEQVVASHPKHNVIIVTHSYLTASGGIYNSADYGNTSPTDLSTRLVRKYANVRMVLSGHTGTSAHRVETGVHGNRIDSWLLAMHSNSTNPVRLIEIDTAAKTMSTRVYAPWDDTSYPAYTAKVIKLGFVR